MKIQLKFRWISAALAATLVFAGLAVAYGARSFNISNGQSAQAPPVSLVDGWYYFDGNRRVDIPMLPASIICDAPDGLLLYRTLPAGMPNAPALSVETHYQTLEAWVGDEKIYTHIVKSNAPTGLILGNVRHLIYLPVGAEGQRLTLRLTAPYSPGKWAVSGIHLGSGGAISQMISASCLETAVFALLFGTLGVVLLALSLLLKCKGLDFNRRSFGYLGLFVLIASLWIVTDSRLGQYIASMNPAALYILSFLSFTVMPVPFMLYLQQISAHGKKTLNVVSALLLLQVILSTVLFYTGVADFAQTLPITHTLMVISMLGSFIICLRDRYFYHNKDTRFALLGICALLLGGLLSLLTFSPLRAQDNSLFFRYGLIVFFILLCYGTLERGMGLLRTSMKAEVYHLLAYTDTMTQLRNRAAFDRDAEAIPAGGGSIAVVISDINNLKLVNDTCGHLAGDRLIIDAAHCIKQALSPLGACYRIGGDEFAAILQGADRRQVEEALMRLEALVEACGTEGVQRLSLAKGLAMGTADGPESVYRLMREADARMYEEKGKHVRYSGT